MTRNCWCSSLTLLPFMFLSVIQEPRLLLHLLPLHPHLCCPLPPALLILLLLLCRPLMEQGEAVPPCWAQSRLSVRANWKRPRLLTAANPSSDSTDRHNPSSTWRPSLQQHDELLVLHCGLDQFTSSLLEMWKQITNKKEKPKYHF